MLVEAMYYEELYAEHYALAVNLALEVSGF